MAKRVLSGKVCIVTGATRGLGKGIALQLGEKGAKVYITGRTRDLCQGSRIGGSLKETAKEIEARGGVCILVQCDHANDDDVKKLFELVDTENNGKLDILVNNAYAGGDSLFEHFGLRFWEMPISIWDVLNGVGLRNNYICAIYAARMMVKRKSGLIVNISAAGGLNRKVSFNVAYGIGKEACDRINGRRLWTGSLKLKRCIC